MQTDRQTGRQTDASRRCPPSEVGGQSGWQAGEKGDEGIELSMSRRTLKGEWEDPNGNSGTLVTTKHGLRF